MHAKRLLVAISLVVAVLWAGSLSSLHIAGKLSFLDRIEASLTDLRSTMLGARQPRPIVSIIAIDDRTAEAEGYPLSRVKLAELVDAIGKMKPKVIALDLLLVDPGPEEGDAALVAALTETPSVIAAAGIFSKSTQMVTSDAGDPLAGIPVADKILLPLARFSDVAAVGVVNVSTDDAGTPRYVPLISRASDRVYPSFSLLAASLSVGVNPAFEPGELALGERHLPTDGGQRLPLTFYGPRGTIATFSAADVFDGKLSSDAVTGKVVVIGSTVTGGGDVFPTPFDPILPGVEVMSTAINHLIVGDNMVRDRNTRATDGVIALALPISLILLLAWRRSAPGYAAIAAIVVLWVGINLLAFDYGYWFSAALPIAATLPPLLLFGALELWFDRRRAIHFAAQSELLQRIEAPGMGEWLARDPSFLSKPVRQEASVVFVDLSGFTALSEAIGVTDVRELLSGFFELVDEVARSHRGAITSFMGDGAMILFGLPRPSADDAARAAACAIMLCERLRQWLSAHPTLSGRKSGFKVGAHCGPVVASRLGTGDRQQITATGDTVNVASRLMEVAAANRAELAASNAIVEAAGGSAVVFRSGRLQDPISASIRGRTEEIDVWLWSGHPL
ncbi:adenylate/guanylate cyclase domain-containing protein [Rhizobium sp. BG6]|uniref:CHASE2 domain-containing protein n=1 Tax=Rhizobium sp. BG6 TaxID=2613771 RepID=UPI00193D9F90|nr:adenylate/guanylate cyclase domain-containing protein [Rhizobium sp. BG6]QRM50758.1 adenylate/guanylate cyclase domain-containing protein [Rhizobium sp. BG6]